MRHIEEDIQSACIKWFSLQFPDIASLCFSVPNGGKRNLREAARLKKTGVRAGVSDLILLVPKGGFSSLCIEMKAGKNDQSEYQKSWQALAERWGNKYVVCRSVDDFMKEVKSYLLS